MNLTSGHVGDRITDPTQMEDLPPGSTVIESGSNRVFTKQENQYWHDTLGGRFLPHQFGMSGNYSIDSLPNGYDSGPRAKKNVDQFGYEFRDGALALALSHGVSFSSVTEALDKMGLPEDRFPLGHGVRVRNDDTKNKLPQGTVVFRGRPEDPSSFGVFVKNSTGRWTHILGENARIPNSVVIDNIKGDREAPEWVARPGTDADDAAIRALKARCWRVGYKLKKSQGWCGTYEQLAQGLGISAADLNNVSHEGMHVGDMVDPEGAHMLPRGSLVRWQSNDHPERFAVYMRVRGMDNRSGTRRIYGQTQDGLRLGHFKESMEIVHIHVEEDTEYLVRDPRREFPLFPPGTVFNFDDSGQDYSVCADGTITDMRPAPGAAPHGHGRWQLSAFGTPRRMIILHLPGNE